MRILVVEDDMLFGNALQKALQRAGYAVDWIENGLEFVGSMRAAEYDCVLLDLGLPGVGGEACLKTLRERSPGLSALVITARGEETLNATAAELRAAYPKVQVVAVAGDIATPAARAASGFTAIARIRRPVRPTMQKAQAAAVAASAKSTPQWRPPKPRRPVTSRIATSPRPSVIHSASSAGTPDTSATAKPITTGVFDTWRHRMK